jgi:hypothetical protein
MVDRQQAAGNRQQAAAMEPGRLEPAMSRQSERAETVFDEAKNRSDSLSHAQ